MSLIKLINNIHPSTRVPAWGETQTIEWIGEYFGAFYYFIVDALVEKGYVRGENLFGAPYDFRKGPSMCSKSQWVISQYQSSIDK